MSVTGEGYELNGQRLSSRQAECEEGERIHQTRLSDRGLATQTSRRSLAANESDLNRSNKEAKITCN